VAIRSHPTPFNRLGSDDYICRPEHSSSLGGTVSLSSTMCQFCLNGHFIATPNDDLFEEGSFCSRCGEASAIRCSNCNEFIWCHVHRLRLVRPNYCRNCSRPYPWTLRMIEAADAFAREVDNPSVTEREALRSSLVEIMKDTPHLEAAVLRLKNVAKKIGSTIAQEALKTLVVEIATPKAKALLGLVTGR
jgi:hypothetical protein